MDQRKCSINLELDQHLFIFNDFNYPASVTVLSLTEKKIVKSNVKANKTYLLTYLLKDDHVDNLNLIDHFD